VIFLYLKAAHVIFVVTWFAGLFYIVRLFVYMAEAHEESDATRREVLLPQYQLMARRLWLGIAWPSAIATLMLGTSLATWFMPTLPSWLMMKLVLVLGLFGYHLACHVLWTRFDQGEAAASPRAMRMFNEVATLFLVAIVFLVVVKDGLALWQGVAGLAALTVFLLIAIQVYAGLRKRSAG